MPIGGSAIRAGRAFMEFFVDDTRVQKGLTQIQRNLRHWGNNLAVVGTALTGAGAAIVGPMALFAREAGNAEIVVRLLSERFGELAGNATAFARQYADATEKSRFTIMESLSTFQGFFLGLGFGTSVSSDFSKALTQMSADLAASEPGIANLDDAIRRFISAMSGSSEVLDRFGINLKVAAIDQELLALGFSTTSATATEQQKTLARLSASIKAMASKGSLGKAIELSNTFRNQLQGLGENFKDLRVAIGTALTGGARPFLSSINNLIQTTIKWVEANQEIVRTAFKIGAALVIAGTAITGLGLTLKVIGIGLSQILLPFTIVKAVIGGVIPLITTFFSVFGGSIPLLITGVGGLVAAFFLLRKAFHDLKPVFMEVFSSMIKGFGTVIALVRQGDLTGAWRATLLVLEQAWLQTWQGMTTYVAGVWNSLSMKWESITRGLAEVLLRAVNTIKNAWKGTVFIMQTTARYFFQFITEHIRRSLSGLRTIAEYPIIGPLALIKGQRRAEFLESQISDERRLLRQSTLSQLQGVNEAIRKSKVQLKNTIGGLWDSPFSEWSPDLAETQSRLAQIRQELENLAADSESTNALNPYTNIADDLLDKVKEIAGTLSGGGAGTGRAASIFGSFSAQAIRGMFFGSQSADEKTARNTAMIAQGVQVGNQHLKRIENKIEGGLVFE